VIGVARPCENDGHRRLRAGGELDPVQRPGGGRGQRLEQVSLEAREDRLGLRVAEAAVELENAWPVVRQHQAGVEKALERCASCCELFENGAVDRLHELVRFVGVEVRDRGVAPHPARVRSLVVVEQPLEVLGRGEGQGPPSSAEGEERYLLAFEELFDNDLAAEGPRPGKRSGHLVLRTTDEDPFSGCEAVRLDHTRGAGLSQPLRSRHSGRPHDLLREGLRALDPRCRGARPEDGDADPPQLVGKPGDERRLGAHDDQVDGEPPAEVENPLRVVRAHLVTGSQRGDARVPGSCMQRAHERALPELPRERVLAPAGADDEDVHQGASLNPPEDAAE
jgi:hypothetical protein